MGPYDAQEAPHGAQRVYNRMVSKKDLRRTQKHLDRLTAAFIQCRPDMLRKYGKEAIRDHLLNMELAKAFKAMEAMQ